MMTRKPLPVTSTHTRCRVFLDDSKKKTHLTRSPFVPSVFTMTMDAELNQDNLHKMIDWLIEKLSAGITLTNTLACRRRHVDVQVCCFDRDETSTETFLNQVTMIGNWIRKLNDNNCLMFSKHWNMRLGCKHNKSPHHDDHQEQVVTASVTRYQQPTHVP